MLQDIYHGCQNWIHNPWVSKRERDLACSCFGKRGKYSHTFFPSFAYLFFSPASGWTQSSDKPSTGAARAPCGSFLVRKLRWSHTSCKMHTATELSYQPAASQQFRAGKWQTGLQSDWGRRGEETVLCLIIPLQRGCCSVILKVKRFRNLDFW